MKAKTFMLIAGEASGDLLASELVTALRSQLPDAQFFGAGGPKMAAAGVELAFDLTQHSVIGITDVLKKYFTFRRLFHELLALAIERQPDVVIGVDYGGFNLRFGQAVKAYIRDNPFSKWNPKIVQFVSPQVWASRPGRARKLARDYDLLLSIFPFEKDWYAQRVPQLRVEFVGHPMIGRFANGDLLSARRTSVTSPDRDEMAQSGKTTGTAHVVAKEPRILLLPGSRKSELQRHLPPMLRALDMIQAVMPGVRAKMVLPNIELKRHLVGPLNQISKELARQGRTMGLNSLPSEPENSPYNIEFQIGELPWALAEADVAIASTGTVTMECAFFGVPTVTLYKTSWLTYQIARRIITVKSLTMPNLLAGETVYPEFVQKDATPENLAQATLGLLQSEPHRVKIKAQLEKIIASLGKPGAAGRAADAVLSLFR